MINDNQCNGIFGRIFGHNFEGRWHSEQIISPEAVSQATIVINKYFEEYSYTDSDDIYEILSEFREMKSSKSTYVHDICTRCGRTLRPND